MDTNTKMVDIIDTNGNKTSVQLVTYLISDDEMSTYMVYFKGETQGAEQDKIIYISKVSNENGKIILSEITDDNEWLDVQNLLKKVANAKQ